jgi:hypothetical protein
MNMSELLSETKASYWLAAFAGRGRGRQTLAIDLGVNIGSFLLVFGRHFDSIIAVDASSKFLESAKFNLRRVANVAFVHAAMAKEAREQVDLRRVYAGADWDPKDLTTTQFETDAVKSSGY